MGFAAFMCILICIADILLMRLVPFRITSIFKGLGRLFHTLTGILWILEIVTMPGVEKFRSCMMFYYCLHFLNFAILGVLFLASFIHLDTFYSVYTTHSVFPSENSVV
ncbi:hypothetical protein NPIL_689361 [Nephila pilipes]|uniref:Uncharacterized protein n=1 Tax=Nephila pilipes TaxID=299642 RepID=A0A8X6NHG7_NEPPI|nr:hypothetical protein NPIL_689361 [Nephila pilipes]